jgi:DNA-binding CsgD family transcriptional regulator
MLAGETRQDCGGEPRGLAVLIQLDEAARSAWADAAVEVGAAPVGATAIHEARLYAAGPRNTCVIAPVDALVSEPQMAPLLDATDTAFRRVTLVALAASPDAAGPWARVAFAAAAMQPQAEAAIAVLRAALAEAERRRGEWDLVEDYHRRHASLTGDELVVHDAVCEGKLNKQIARELGVSIRTVEQRRRRVFSKMGVASAVPLVDRVATVRTLERRFDRRDPLIGPTVVPMPHYSEPMPGAINSPDTGKSTSATR